MPDIEVRRPGDLGRVLAAVRVDRGIRQEDLANELAVSRTYLAGLESGKTTAQLLRLFRALRALGIRVSVSFDDAPALPATNRPEQQPETVLHKESRR